MLRIQKGYGLVYQALKSFSLGLLCIFAHHDLCDFNLKVEGHLYDDSITGVGKSERGRSYGTF